MTSQENILNYTYPSRNFYPKVEKTPSISQWMRIVKEAEECRDYQYQYCVQKAGGIVFENFGEMSFETLYTLVLRKINFSLWYELEEIRDRNMVKNSTYELYDNWRIKVSEEDAGRLLYIRKNLLP